MAERQTVLLLALFTAAALWVFSRTKSGQTAVADATDYVGGFLQGPRGIRNNNPGNIVRNTATEQFQGVLSDQDLANLGIPKDNTFLQFDTAENGIRAIGKILNSYAIAGWNTPASIADHWSATDQAAYVARMSAALGVNENTQVDIATLKLPIAKAIIGQEEGQEPWTDDTLTAWVYET